MTASESLFQQDVGKPYSTKDHILCIAERLFCECGFDAVSLRSITTAAHVNTAAIHYHFGSKSALMEELFVQRSEPISRRRLELLNTCQEAPGRPPLLEQLISAFVTPVFEHSQDPAGAMFVRLRARLACESSEFTRKLFLRMFDESSRRYIEAFQGALPNISKEDVCWRFHFLLGSMMYTMANPGRIQFLSDGLCDPGNVDEAVRQMVPFIAAGFRAPSSPAA